MDKAFQDIIDFLDNQIKSDLISADLYHYPECKTYYGRVYAYRDCLYYVKALRDVYKSRFNSK